jgi:hypothetical protein
VVARGEAGKINGGLQFIAIGLTAYCVHTLFELADGWVHACIHSVTLFLYPWLSSSSSSRLHSFPFSRF